MNQLTHELITLDRDALDSVAGGAQQCQYNVRIRPWGPNYQQTCTRSSYSKCIDSLPKGYTAQDMRETCGMPR